ncbi:hypothetical protein NHX12_005956 [Muraenolepis orangiensis]|uniref:USP domain-containing protein n=1 Tax=Muraenolepis orangiensis TaxID=630683 RepID=A0A9Q0IAT6_9TELE|nr:hypothetical protein NHX12_005956 [Muraenolepis orangiensis]
MTTTKHPTSDLPILWIYRFHRMPLPGSPVLLSPLLHPSLSLSLLLSPLFTSPPPLSSSVSLTNDICPSSSLPSSPSPTGSLDGRSSSSSAGLDSDSQEGGEQSGSDRLPNIGNSCFLNWALQCLYSLPSFSGDIRRQEALWSPQRRTSLNLLRDLGELHKSRKGQSSYKDKRGLLRSIKSSLAEFNEEYNDYSEQFLLLLFMKMKMEAETLQWASSSPSYVCPVRNFEFSGCGDKVFQEEEQNNLSLDLHPLLTGGLELYFKASELECTCWRCSGRQATVVRHFLTLPRVLVLHLKRFHRDGRRLRKATDAVSIPPLLSLASLVGEQGDAAGRDTPRYQKGDCHSAQDTAPTDFSGDKEREHQDVSVKDHCDQTSYRLSGIVSHFGDSIDTGHYISDTAGENGPGWLTLNDWDGRTTAETTVLKTRDQTAYILFYFLCGAGKEGHVVPGQN